ncbi:Uncharacterised protein [Serratia fonticola]|nr:Uncharacterised protein [Serratia fonticola]CAI0912337.1 Uncharacterised protein [Serratia fonticola]CAI1657840.1 Uncharacterised protein [Serratia fonticola]CAI1873458.1 Uncharacterised protein [Serratia fonticola]CAI1883996.1 Uncharacterised protein [Serratia fonticola]
MTKIGFPSPAMLHLVRLPLDLTPKYNHLTFIMNRSALVFASSTRQARQKKQGIGCIRNIVALISNTAY